MYERTDDWLCRSRVKQLGRREGHNDLGAERAESDEPAPACELATRAPSFDSWP